MKRIALIVLATVLVFATSFFEFVNTAHANTGQPAAINPSANQLLTQPAPTRATIVVNSIEDVVNDPSVTTFRDAIDKANADSGKDLIEFDRYLFSKAQTITLKLGELDITDSLDIIAPQDTRTGRHLVTVSGNNASRVFKIESRAAVTLVGLIVESGRVTQENGGGIENFGELTLNSSIVRNNSAVTGFHNSEGGGIYNVGNLTVNNSTITGNSAHSGSGIHNVGNLMVVNKSTISHNSGTWFGGGIYNASGTVTVNKSSISNNSSRGFGGGIYNQGTGTSTVTYSTISGNSAGSSGAGGGIYNEGTSTVTYSTISGNLGDAHGGGIYNEGTSTVNNSTISDNNSGAFGGGIHNRGSNTVNNSTISGNSGGHSGGIFNTGTNTITYTTISGNVSSFGGGVETSDASDSNSFKVRNTIIAGNNTVFGQNLDVSGLFTSDGYNLIGKSTDNTGFGNKGDIVGTTDKPIDPLLGSLSNNGGSTQTIPLLPDSPAIRAANPNILGTDPTTDQRGLPRRAADGSADIGAFQLNL